MRKKTIEQEFEWEVLKLSLASGLRHHCNMKSITLSVQFSEDEEVKIELVKAFKNFLDPTLEAVSERIANVVRTPEARVREASIKSIKRLREENIDIHELPFHVGKPILEGIGYGYPDKCIQDKYQILLTKALAGDFSRRSYSKIIDEFDPQDMKLFDFIFNAKKEYDLNKGISEDGLPVIDIQKLPELCNMDRESCKVSADKLVRAQLCEYLTDSNRDDVVYLKKIDTKEPREIKARKKLGVFMSSLGIDFGKFCGELNLGNMKARATN